MNERAIAERVARSVIVAESVTAKWGKKVKITNPGKYEGYDLGELRSMRDAAKARQEKRDKADPKDTSLLRELDFAIRAKTGWGSID